MKLRNCASYWFPLVQASGVPVPETRIVHAPPLHALLDSETPEGWEAFLANLRGAIAEIGGVPCFLRTGQTSGKHQWRDTCYLADLDELGRHVAALVEFSELVDLMGLPSDVWVVRRLIKTAPLFTAFNGFPVTREFRVFVEDGAIKCTHAYWPVSAVEEGRADDADWKVKLYGASFFSDSDGQTVHALARQAGSALPGAWSVDVLQDADGKWWLTDCADAGCSFHWEGCPNEKRWKRRMFTEDAA